MKVVSEKINLSMPILFVAFLVLLGVTVAQHNWMVALGAAWGAYAVNPLRQKASWKRWICN